MTNKQNKNTIHTNDNTNVANLAKKTTEQLTKQKKQSRIKNHTTYNKSLVNRGKVSLLISPEVFLPPRPTKHVGRKQEYPDALILFLAALREIIQKPFRQTIGFAEELAILHDVKLPSYNRLCVRMQQLNIEQKLDKRHFRKVCLLLDSTGLKNKGEGEWKVRKHGSSYRRGWTKLHLSIDYTTQVILSHIETSDKVGDSTVATDLIDKTHISHTNIDQVLGDGAYGSHKLYQEIEGKRNIKLLSPPHKNAKLHVRYTETHPGRRCSGGKYADFIDEEGWETHNQYLRDCLKNGWDKWKDNTGYHRRSLVETAMWRLKSAFSDKLKSTSSKNQNIETTIRIMLMNKWTIQNQDIYKKEY